MNRWMRFMDTYIDYMLWAAVAMIGCVLGLAFSRWMGWS